MYFRFFLKIMDSLEWIPIARMKQRAKRALKLRLVHLRQLPWHVPYGLRWFGVDEAQRLLDLLDVMWTVVGHDWEWPQRPHR
jgi:hypothetical protein